MTDGTFTEAEVREKLTELQAELKTQVSCIRKPVPYTEDRDIQEYIEDFNSYRRIAGLPKRVTYGTVFTYLPDTLRRKLRALQLTEEQMADGDNVQGVVIKALSSPISRIQAKTRLQIVKQGSTESIRDFVERLTTLIDRCYDDTVEPEAKTLILKDTFVKGLHDERVSLAVLVESKDLPLPELVKIARKHELARKAYSLFHQPQKGEEVVSVLTVNQEDERTIGNLNEGKREPKKRCYGCGSTFHQLSRCPHQRTPFTRQRQPDRIN